MTAMARIGARLGLAEIRRDTRRSFLSIFSIALGVGSVLLMTSLQRGVQKSTEERIARMGGTSMFEVERLNPSDAQEELMFEKSPGLTLQQLEQLKDAVPDIEEIFIEGARGWGQIGAAGKRSRSRVTAVSWNYLEQFNLKLDRLLMPEAELAERWERGEALCVVGPQLAESLLRRGTDPLGKDLIYEGARFKVAGVLETFSRWDWRGRHFYFPLGVYFARFAGMRAPLEEAKIKVRDPSRMEAAIAATDKFLLRAHRGIRDFEIETREDRIADSQNAARVMGLVGTGIAAMALAVGGIGILNLMLATIQSRIREIGVRKALGATDTSVLMQFLVEALGVSLLGTGFGFLIGSALTFVPAGSLPWTPELALVDYFLCGSLGVLTGLSAGIYPALRAARLVPVEALRHV